MYVSSLSIERFGSWSNLGLESMSEGLNVVAGPPGSGKSAVLSFLRAMYGGFDEEIRQRYLMHTSRGCGGSMTVQTREGKHTITRYDDGSREGRLTVQRPDGAVIGWRHLHDLLGDFPLALLAKAYCVDFEARPELTDLLSEAQRCGLPLTAPGADARRPPEPERALAGRENRHESLRRQIATLERALSELDRRRETIGVLRRHPEPPALPGADRTAASERLAARLRSVEMQLRRWKRTLREVAARKQRGTESVERRLLAGPPGGSSLAQPRRILKSLEQRIHHVQRQVERIAPQVGQSCQCQSLHAAVTGALRELSQEVYEACNALNSWQALDQQQHVTEERDQLARCEIELRKAIRTLNRRRQAILEQIDAARPPFALHPDHGRFCECAAHPPSAAGAAGRSRPVSDAWLSPGETATEIRRLANERLRRLAELAELEVEAHEVRTQHARQDDGAVGLTAAASEYLRQMSAQEWRGIRLATPLDAGTGWQVVVEDRAGRSIAERDLPAGVRDQIYLAFCLAVVAAGERRGWRLPLVVNAAFNDFPARDTEHVVALLRSVGARHQVVCLTRHEHVAAVARQLNVPVRNLSAPVYEAEPRRLGVAPATGAAPSRRLPGTFAQTDLVDGDFLLHEHDPIERAPSVDEAGAHRLRQAGIVRVGDLLRLEVAEAAQELRPAGISAEILESWQAQSRLMCQLRGLRPYDARLLVACGIRSSEQLVQMQPGALRARVSELAANPQRQGILLSGTESELSRVTDWIHSARDVVGPVDRERPARMVVTAEGDVAYGAVAGAVGPPPSQEPQPVRRRRPRRSNDEVAARGGRRWEKRGAPRPATADPSVPAVVSLTDADLPLRYYLRRSDPIDAAPAIGPAMARRLQAAGLATVAELLDVPAEAAAARLGHRRIDADAIRRWQQLSELVCRVPGLRGHDAQFIAAAGIHSVEELASASPAPLFRDVQNVLGTLEGKRVLRGGTEPDLAEVTQWIESAKRARALLAA